MVNLSLPLLLITQEPNKGSFSDIIHSIDCEWIIFIIIFFLIILSINLIFVWISKYSWAEVDQSIDKLKFIDRIRIFGNEFYGYFLIFLGLVIVLPVKYRIFSKENFIEFLSLLLIIVSILISYRGFYLIIKYNFHRRHKIAPFFISYVLPFLLPVFIFIVHDIWFSLSTIHWPGKNEPVITTQITQPVSKPPEEIVKILKFLETNTMPVAGISNEKYPLGNTGYIRPNYVFEHIKSNQTIGKEVYPPGTTGGPINTNSSNVSFSQNKQDKIEDEEYAVYSSYFNEFYRNSIQSDSILVVENYTDPESDKPNIYYEFTPEYPNSPSLYPKVNDDTINDYLIKNKESFLINKRFKMKIKYVVVSQDEIKKSMASKGWEGFHKKYPHSFSKYIISRVGFNKRKDQAMFHIYSSFGPKGCLGEYILMEKKNGIWIYQGRQMNSIC